MPVCVSCLAVVVTCVSACVCHVFACGRHMSACVCVMCLYANSPHAVDVARRLADKVDRVRARFDAKVASCSPVDPAVLRHCDVALKVLHGVIRRLTGSILHRVHLLTSQVIPCTRPRALSPLSHTSAHTSTAHLA